MLSMWGLPAFAVGCSQVLIPSEKPTLIRNYDYDQALFEGVIASTNYSGRPPGTGDQRHALGSAGRDERGRAGDLADLRRTTGRWPGGFGIPIVMRYVLETCATIEQGVSALRRIPVAQSYNVALVDTNGSHATVFVGPEQVAVVSRLRRRPTTGQSSRTPPNAARFNNVGRLARWTNCEATTHGRAPRRGDAAATVAQRPVRRRLRHAIHRQVPACSRNSDVVLA